MNVSLTHEEYERLPYREDTKDWEVGKDYRSHHWIGCVFRYQGNRNLNQDHWACSMVDFA